MEIFKAHPQWEDVKRICTVLKNKGHTAWLAGGCVRDGLLGVLPKDFDVATNAKPHEIEKLFSKTVDVGKAFGVIRVIEGSGDIEVATFRRDGPYSDSRHPDKIELSTPEEDAKRRDFTVNALFFDVFEEKVHDFVEGQKDLEKRLIRTVGDANDRFNEDKLRVLRAIRFVAQLDFELEDKTYKAVKRMADSILKVSWERIQDELTKLFKGKRPDRGVELLKSSGLLEILFPDHVKSRLSHALFSKIAGLPDADLLGWGLVFAAIPIDAHKTSFKKLKFSNEFSQRVQAVLETAERLKTFKDLSVAEKKRISSHRNIEQALLFAALKDKVEPSVRKFIFENRQLPERLLESKDLLSVGLKPGKDFGQWLENSFNAQLEGKFETKTQGLEWLKKQIKSPRSKK